MTDFQSMLDEQAQRFRVPGAALGILDRESVEVAATGMANTRAGIETTPETLFQIGSITKVYTTTLVMQLLDEEAIDLDAPVVSYLPEFRLAGGEAEAITVRHLLCHTNGIPGDHFGDFGRGRDAVKRCVASLAAMAPHYAAGTLFSYSNSAFVVAGRIVEVLRGKSWHDVLRERVLEPLGLERTATLADTAILHRVAVGHIYDAVADEFRVAPVWNLVEAQAPAGATPAASAADLLGVAKMHLDGGRGVLSEKSVRTMQERQVADVGVVDQVTGWGLGWALFEWDKKVVGHDGGTIGQQSFLRLVPDAGAAVCLLTNGGLSAQLYRKVVSAVMKERWDVTMPRAPKASEHPPPDLDLSPFPGTYERLGWRYVVELKNGNLHVTSTDTSPTAALNPPIPSGVMQPVDGTTFMIPGVAGLTLPAKFIGIADGRATWLHAAHRAARRVD